MSIYAKSEWPETVGMDVADAIKLIKAEFNGCDAYDHPTQYAMQHDYVSNRVAVMTKNGKVVEPPKVG